MMIFPSLIKACDLAVFLLVSWMLALYIHALWSLRGIDNKGFARNLCLGIVVGWSGSLILYGNLNYVYWTHQLLPMVSPAAPTVRLAYSSLTMVGASMHIATSLSTGGHWWRTLGILGVIVVLFIFAVTSLDLHGMI